MTITDSSGNFYEIVKRYYNKDIQLSPAKIELIAGAIFNRSPGCNLLVFGLGNDSPLWHNLNESGTTLFVENSSEWIESTLQRYPYLKVIKNTYEGCTVRRSLRSPATAIRRAGKAPDELSATPWDVIIIDAPGGNRPHHPGRAWPIAWTTHISSTATHIFVDDYNRELEQSFSNFLLLSGRPNFAVLAPAGSKSHLLYSIGRSDAFD